MSGVPDSHRPHAVNLDPRLHAVAADLEYFRTKRLEWLEPAHPRG